MKLDIKQKTELAKTLNDIAKLTITALVIGQFVVVEHFNIPVFILGTLVSLSLIIIATVLNKEEE